MPDQFLPTWCAGEKHRLAEGVVPFCEPLLHGNPARGKTHAMNTSNHSTSQGSNGPDHAVADLIDDVPKLTGALDSFALSFPLAWRQHLDHQREHFPITSQPERTTL